MGFGGGREIIKIPPAARATLHDYLTAQYRHECGPKVKDPPDECDETKPLYASSALSAKDSEPLPSDVVRQLGFIDPGTAYVEAGYVVYLIHLPRHIILDSVSVNEGPDTSLNRYFNKQ